MAAERLDAKLRSAQASCTTSESERRRKRIAARALGMKIAEKAGERADVLNAIGAHHDEIEMTSLLSPIIQVCDAISGHVLGHDGDGRSLHPAPA